MHLSLNMELKISKQDHEKPITVVKYIFILVSKKKTEIKHLVPKDLTYEHIICKAILVDCIYIDEEFIEKENNHNYNNFICSKYEVGIYAWVLDNIRQLYRSKRTTWNLEL